jgi:hypothetical protein
VVSKITTFSLAVSLLIVLSPLFKCFILVSKSKKPPGLWLRRCGRTRVYIVRPT